VDGMLIAEFAMLFKFHAVGMIFSFFFGFIIALLAFQTSKGYFGSHFSMHTFLFDFFNLFGSAIKKDSAP